MTPAVAGRILTWTSSAGGLSPHDPPRMPALSTRSLDLAMTRAALPRRRRLQRAGSRAVLVEPQALPFDVVESRVQVPQAAGSVSRTALVNRLRAAGAFPLVLVVAPAGYGKTTLL